jgi:hypothetical protein
MTTQVLMSNSATLSETAETNNAQPSEGNARASEVVTAASNTDIPQTHRLPYQASHQVELLHLQAEIEALFQQLKSLQQQRSVELKEEDKTPVLASR